MRATAKILTAILALTALGFCVAFVMESIWQRASASRPLARNLEEPSRDDAAVKVSEAPGDDWKVRIRESAVDELAFTERLLAEGELEGGLLLAVSIEGWDVERLQGHFVELMARDLEDYRAVLYAGRVLEEIARQQPALGVALLSALSPAEKERLVPSLARGWTLRDAEGAFAWIGSAWVQPDGQYIDRALQNGLYLSAMETLVADAGNFALAAETLAGLADPELKRQLTELVAWRIVRDGPESALDRLAGEGSGLFDASVMDAVAEQWAARDGAGAAAWAVENEAEVSLAGVRSIAKHLALGANEGELRGFYEGLESVARRDSAAAEAARLKARREPAASANWVLAIERPEARRAAVFDALYEIGYDDFSSSVNYIDFVYEAGDAERGPVVYATLRDWLPVDVEAVAGYLGSGRANLSAALSEDLLLEIEAYFPQG